VRLIIQGGIVIPVEYVFVDKLVLGPGALKNSTFTCSIFFNLNTLKYTKPTKQFTRKRFFYLKKEVGIFTKHFLNGKQSMFLKISPLMALISILKS